MTFNLHPNPIWQLTKHLMALQSRYNYKTKPSIIDTHKRESGMHESEDKLLKLNAGKGRCQEPTVAIKLESFGEKRRGSSAGLRPTVTHFCRIFEPLGFWGYLIDTFCYIHYLQKGKGPKCQETLHARVLHSSRRTFLLSLPFWQVNRRKVRWFSLCRSPGAPVFSPLFPFRCSSTGATALLLCKSPDLQETFLLSGTKTMRQHAGVRWPVACALLVMCSGKSSCSMLTNG